jgi:integrase
MATIFQRGKTWWGRAQRDNREYRFSLRTTDRRTAEKRLRQWLNDMDAVAWGDKPPRPWAAVVERFIKEHFPTIRPQSGRRYAASLKNLSRVLLGKNVQQVTTGLLSEFETMRRTEGATAPTIRRDLACLSCLMSYCEEWEWIEDGANIVPAYMRRRRRKGLREAPGRTRYLSEAEEAALLQHASEPARTAIKVAIETGLREQELMKLRWEQIDFRGGTIRLGTTTKGKRERFAPLAQDPAQLLARRPRHIRSPFVFHHDDGKPYGRLRRAFETAMRKAGLKDLHWHDLRRTAGCRWLQRDGMSMDEVSAMLGHATVAITQRSYAFLDLEATAQKSAQRTADKQAKE